jgi:hypothetical protein
MLECFQKDTIKKLFQTTVVYVRVETILFLRVQSLTKGIPEPATIYVQEKYDD